MKTKQELIALIESKPARSAWSKAVKQYAVELIEDMETINPETLKVDLLNGEKDWREFSSGGCSLIYDGDIAERVCSPSELKKTRQGERAPNSRESWLDCQARALGQAAAMICRLAKA